MVNINKLKAKLVENGMTVSELASLIEVNPSTLYRRFQLGENFTIKEANEIAMILGLSAKELNEIFFAELVADMQRK